MEQKSLMFNMMEMSLVSDKGMDMITPIMQMNEVILVKNLECEDSINSLLCQVPFKTLILYARLPTLSNLGKLFHCY